MAKYIERVGKRTILGGLGQLYDYECPVCHRTYSTKKSCMSHVYREHREWAHKDTEREFREL